MSQIGLPFQRHSDTSREAARSMKPHAGTLRDKVFLAIRLAGAWGLTDEEIGEVTQLRGDTVRPRRVELVNQERIMAFGTRPTTSGRKATVWVVRGGGAA